MTLQIEPERQEFTLSRVVDGDTPHGIVVRTLDSRLFGQLRQEMPVKLRPLRVDTPETNRPATREAGLWWKAFTEEWFRLNLLESGMYVAYLYAPDSFGRWLCEIWDHDEVSNLSDDILFEAGRRGENVSASAEAQIAEALSQAIV